jgi:hypothetical protein
MSNISFLRSILYFTSLGVLKFYLLMMTYDKKVLLIMVKIYKFLKTNFYLINNSNIISI